MLGHRLAPVMIVALAAAGLATPVALPTAAWAQESIRAPCRLCGSASAGENGKAPPTPLRLEVQTRLEFDKVVFGGTGQALVTMSPDGVTRMTGAASATGARAMPGSVLIRGEPGHPVRVDLPHQVQLFGEGNGAIQIDSIVTDLPPFPRIGDDGTLSFRFGGDLRISGDGDGAYHGSVDIIVEYL